MRFNAIFFRKMNNFEKFKNSDLLTVNFTNIPTDEFYRILFEVNKELILDFYQHTSNDMKDAHQMIENFYNLYFRDCVNFRGARHFEKKENSDNHISNS